MRGFVLKAQAKMPIFFSGQTEGEFQVRMVICTSPFEAHMFTVRDDAVDIAAHPALAAFDWEVVEMEFGGSFDGLESWTGEMQ